MPPHTSHATQTLDFGVFSQLKAQWSATYHDFFQRNPGKVITKFNFNQLISQAWLKSLIPANVISEFKVCGIYPFKRKAIRAVPNQGSGKVADNEVVVAASIQAVPNQDNGKVGDNEVVSATSIQALDNTCEEVSAPEEKIEVFSTEQEQLFIRRFEEGYDLCTDSAYNQWLEKNHPEVISDFVEPLFGTSSSI